ncbi:MAG: ATP-binding protein [Chloroflexota bacterium]
MSADDKLRHLTAWRVGHEQGFSFATIDLETGTHQIVEPQRAYGDGILTADGAYFVDLERIDSADLLVPMIAEALQFHLTGPEQSEDQIIAYLRDKSLLLVLDNFEHVLDGAPVLADLIAAAPRVRALVTSREALRLQEEHVFALDGLAVPDSAASTDEIRQSSAVQLFIARARQARHDFAVEPRDTLDDIVEICRIVDGTPLAIELAAVWARLLEPAEILRELQACLDFLETDLRNIPPRHRSIRAVFDGSWNRLTPVEQRTLKRLAVFQNGFDRAAAERVADTRLATLAALRDKSLLVVSADGRYSLHALIRQYAREVLEADPDEAHHIGGAHSAYYAGLTHEMGVQLRGAQQVEALQRMRRDIQNIRVGWAWAAAHARDDLLQSYLFALALYYQMQSRTQEALALLTLTDTAFAALPAEVCGQIHLLRGWMLIMQWRNLEGVETAWAALEALESYPSWLAMVPALNQPELLGDRYGVIRQILETLKGETGDIWQRAWIHKALGEVAFVAGEYAVAVDELKQSGEYFQQIGDGWATTWAYGSLGQALVNLGHVD